MQVDDRIRNCTAFVGTGTATNFVAHGTGFFVNVEEDGLTFDYFITAQHLIWPRRRKTGAPPDTPMAIRVNTEIGGAEVLGANPKHWFYPEDPHIDICALYGVDRDLNAPKEDLNIASIHLESMTVGPHNAEALGLSLGDEVFISGAFVGRVGYRKNIPVIRVANIAAMPEEPIDFAAPRTPAYLIETRSLGGTSGSPIFLNVEKERLRGAVRHGVRMDVLPQGNENKRREHLIMPYYLLGMIISSHGGSYLQDFVSESDSDIHPFRDADFNAGIAVALPVSVITDLLNADHVKEARMTELEKRKRASGVRPASAVRQTQENGNSTDCRNSMRSRN